MYIILASVASVAFIIGLVICSLRLRLLLVFLVRYVLMAAGCNIMVSELSKL